MLDFEQEQRRRWPGLRTLGTEVDFSGLVGSKGTKITGQIDRVDSVADRLVVIDYKNSAIAQNFSTWKKKNFWQPLIYAYAIENGWIEEWSQGVSAKETRANLAGIFIYDVRKRSKGTGLRLRENNEDIFDFTSRSKGQSREDLDKAFADLETTIAIIDETLSTGRYLPEPADPNECDRCRWRASCRAPHLELT
jgi:hypothetical protein